MYKSIIVFAADHRTNVDWNLPYTRLGNCQSDALLKVTTIPVLWHKQMSEIAQAIDIKNKWKELGSPDCLGLCHYRRFFTIAVDFKKKLYDLPASEFNPALCCTPIQQLALLKSHNADMICFARVKSYADSNEDKIHNVVDELELYGKQVNLNMTRQQLNTVFDIFYKNLQNDLKMHFDQAMNQTTVHCCNIFTSKAHLFCDWASTVEATYKECKQLFSKEDSYQSFSLRWFSYIAERLTSIYLDCCELSGMKKIYLPLLTIDGNVHNEK